MILRWSQLTSYMHMLRQLWQGRLEPWWHKFSSSSFQMSPCKTHGIHGVFALLCWLRSNNISWDPSWQQHTVLLVFVVIYGWHSRHNHNSDSVLQILHQQFLLKPRYGKPYMFLDDKLYKIRLHNGVWAWTMHPTKDVSEAVTNCKVYLMINYSVWWMLPKGAETSFGMRYDLNWM